MNDQFEHVGPRVMARNVELPPWTDQLFGDVVFANGLAAASAGL
jgi:hypothetical protein